MKRAHLLLAAVALAILGGCVVVPAGYYYDHPHRYYDRDRYYRGG